MTFKIVDGREYFYQWDLNRQIIVDDPAIKEVHFCNRNDDCSLVVEVENGIANVPNILLQKSFSIRVFAYDGHATLFDKVFEVKARTKPSDYVYTETEVKRLEDVEEKLFKEINERLEEIEGGLITDGFATKEYVDEAVSNVSVDLSGYAKESYVDEAVNKAKPDLSGYAKKTEIPDVSKFITNIPSEYITESELNSKGYLTQHQDISGKADKNHTHSEYAKTKHTHDMADVNGLQSAIANRATQEDIDKAIELHNHNDLYAAKEHNHDDKYATRGHVHSYNDLSDKPEIPSVEGLASEAYVNAAVKTVKPDLTGYATKNHVETNYVGKNDLQALELASKDHVETNYVNKNDLQALDLVSKDYVDNAIANIEIPEGGDVDLSNYYTKEEIDTTVAALEAADKVVSVTARIPRGDRTSYYLSEEDGPKVYANPSKYTISYQNLEYHFYKKTGVALYYVSEGININISNSDDFIFKAIKIALPSLDISEITSVDVASKAYVDEAVSNTGGSGDLSNYYTKSEVDGLIPDTSSFITEVPAEYITETELNNKGYATEQYVTDAIAGIDIPESGGGSAEGAVSYLEAQELTAEQKSTARKNLDLHYESTEETTIFDKVNNVTITANANSSAYIYDNGYRFKELLNLPEGVKFTVTVTSPDDTFTETVEYETFGTNWYRTTTDCTNLLFFDTVSKSLNTQGNYFYFAKKSTDAILSTSSSSWKFKVVFWKPTYNNLIAKEFLNAPIITNVKYIAAGSGSLPTAVFNSPRDEAAGYTIPNGNVVFGGSNKIYNGSGAFIVGGYNKIPSNNSSNLLIGRNNVCGWTASGSGVSPFTKAFMLGNDLKGSQNAKYIPFVLGQYNDRTSKYIPFNTSTTYNTGDYVTVYQTNFTPAVWRCLQDGLKGSGNQPPTSGTTSNAKWEYIDTGSTTEYLFTLGNGTSESARSNAFTIDALGNVVSAGTMTPTGADYAEYFEFVDGNPNREDRIGYLVELAGAKIKLANGTDILGAVSSTMGVIGDAEEMGWHGKYERDDFGRPIFEEVEVVRTRMVEDEETGEMKEEEYTELVTTKKLSKEYDPNRHYAPRSDRPEWAPVGLLGKVLVRHDGTLSAGDYVKAINGIASKSEEKTNVRVLEVVSENVIRVLIK